jgi:hypothetical protein
MKLRIMKLRIPSLDTTVWIAISIAGLAILIFIVWIFSGTSITVINQGASATSKITGLPCANANKRPLAVMLASDPEARPLSGLSAADIVFEMPVTPNGITRMMAIFQCSQPKEIGSIRSARQDFIPLAQGMDAILAHWGGERDALAALNGHVIDNIDAMTYEGSTFYRKSSIPRPHNGFTTMQLLEERADDLGYRASTSLSTYPHTTAPKSQNIGTLADTVTASWPQKMDVRFSYDTASKAYLRWRGGTPEIDKLTGKQVSAAVVVVLKTDATFLYDQYIHVRAIGSGNATIWQGGKRIDAHWNKTSATDMLTFTDIKSAPISFIPGNIWILLDAPLPSI